MSKRRTRGVLAFLLALAFTLTALPFSRDASAASLAPRQREVQTVDQDGYLSVHQYLNPTDDPDVYKVEMTIRVQMNKPILDVFYLLDSSMETRDPAVWSQIIQGVKASANILLDPHKNPNGEQGATRTRLWIVQYDGTSKPITNIYMSDESIGQQYDLSIPRLKFSIPELGTYGAGLQRNKVTTYSLTDLNGKGKAAGTLNTTNYPNPIAGHTAPINNQRYIATGLAQVYNVLAELETCRITRDPKELFPWPDRAVVFLASAGGDFQDVFDSEGFTKIVASPTGSGEVLQEGVMRREAIMVAKALKAVDKGKKVDTRVPSGALAGAYTSTSTGKFAGILDTTGTTATNVSYALPKAFDMLTHEVQASSVQNGAGVPQPRDAATLPNTDATLPMLSPLTFANGTENGGNSDTLVLDMNFDPSPANAGTVGSRYRLQNQKRESGYDANPFSANLNAHDGLSVLRYDESATVGNKAERAVQPLMRDVYQLIERHGGQSAEIWTMALDIPQTPANNPTLTGAEKFDSAEKLQTPASASNYDDIRSKMDARSFIGASSDAWTQSSSDTKTYEISTNQPVSGDGGGPTDNSGGDGKSNAATARGLRDYGLLAHDGIQVRFNHINANVPTKTMTTPLRGWADVWSGATWVAANGPDTSVMNPTTAHSSLPQSTATIVGSTGLPPSAYNGNVTGTTITTNQGTVQLWTVDVNGQNNHATAAYNSPPTFEVNVPTKFANMADGPNLMGQVADGIDNGTSWGWNVPAKSTLPGPNVDGMAATADPNPRGLPYDPEFNIALNKSDSDNHNNYLSHALGSGANPNDPTNYATSSNTNISHNANLVWLRSAVSTPQRYSAANAPARTRLDYERYRSVATGAHSTAGGNGFSGIPAVTAAILGSQPPGTTAIGDHAPALIGAAWFLPGPTGSGNSSTAHSIDYSSESKGSYPPGTINFANNGVQGDPTWGTIIDAPGQTKIEQTLSVVAGSGDKATLNDSDFAYPQKYSKDKYNVQSRNHGNMVNGVDGRHNDHTSEYLMVLAGDYAASNEGMNNSNWKDNWYTWGAPMGNTEPHKRTQFGGFWTQDTYNITLAQFTAKRTRRADWHSHYVSSGSYAWNTTPSSESDNWDGFTPTTPAQSGPINQYRQDLDWYFFYNDYHFQEVIGATITIDGYKKAIDEYKSANLNKTGTGTGKSLSDYPLMYRYVKPFTKNNNVGEEQTIYQFKKYTYELFRVSDAAYLESMLSKYFGFAKPTMIHTKYTHQTVIPEIYMDGTGTVRIDGKRLKWDLDGIYIGSEYRLEFMVEMLDRDNLMADTWYPLTEYTYVEMVMRSMFHSDGRITYGDQSSRYVTYSSLRLFPQVYANGNGKIKEDEVAPEAPKPTDSGVFAYVMPYVFEPGPAPEIPKTISSESLEEGTTANGLDAHGNAIVPVTADNASRTKVIAILSVLVVGVLGVFVLRRRRSM